MVQDVELRGLGLGCVGNDIWRGWRGGPGECAERVVHVEHLREGLRYIVQRLVFRV